MPGRLPSCRAPLKVHLMAETLIKDGPTWTEERDETLRQLQATGLSSSQIGARMDLTRNQVIGRIHRLGIQMGGRGRHATARKKSVLAPKAPLPATVKAKPLPRLRANPVDVNRLKAAEARMAIALQPAERAPTVGRVSLLDLQPHQCKFPLGDPRQDGFGFCGADRVEGRPYCSKHVAICCSPGSNLRPVGLPRSVMEQAA